ncbi:hypothetical protein [Noviherbaspirillum sedimenti]|uniref:hypothetical protein n=1 Tax=Noviherbaspirillum sedimenti TaxID=2320865 RepID=UPI0011C4154A|nr:hypothetical protein [Noviherbaspirillum sedimenti]
MMTPPIGFEMSGALSAIAMPSISGTFAPHALIRFGTGVAFASTTIAKSETVTGATDRAAGR